LIEMGKVVLESGGSVGEPLVIETIGAGDLLGWSWVFPPYVWQFTARAVEPTSAIFFYGATLRQCCEKDHSFGFELLKRISAVMVRRLQAAQKQMVSAYAPAHFALADHLRLAVRAREPDLSEYD
jgi:CRP-like cAMP-binding protein